MINTIKKFVEFLIPPPLQLPDLIADSRPINLLLVEDDPNQQEQLQLLLRNRDVRVVVASSVSEALDELANNHIDVLCLDWVLGSDRRGGLTIFHRWQSVNPGAPCLVLSAYMTDNQRLDLLRDGATNALQKPVGLDIISRLIGNYTHIIRLELDMDNAKRNIMQLKEALLTIEQSRQRQQQTFLIIILFVLLSVISSNFSQLSHIIEAIKAVL